MKKLVALILAVLTAFTLLSIAEIPSPVPDIKIEIEVENPEAGTDFFFEVSYDEAKQEFARNELQKLAEKEDVAEYFRAAADDAKTILDKESVDVTEFAPVVAGNYVEEMGNVKLSIACPTLFEEGQSVAVLFGIADEWIAYQGVGTADGKVELSLDPAMVLAIQDATNALMAIAV